MPAGPAAGLGRVLVSNLSLFTVDSQVENGHLIVSKYPSYNNTAIRYYCHLGGGLGGRGRALRLLALLLALLLLLASAGSAGAAWAAGLLLLAGHAGALGVIALGGLARADAALLVPVRLGGMTTCQRQCTTVP